MSLVTLACAESLLYTPVSPEPASVKMTEVQECIEPILFKLETSRLQDISGFCSTCQVVTLKFYKYFDRVETVSLEMSPTYKLTRTYRNSLKVHGKFLLVKILHKLEFVSWFVPIPSHYQLFYCT